MKDEWINGYSIYFLYYDGENIIISVSLTQLVGILHIIYRGCGSNPGHPTSPQFNWVSSSH